MKPERFQPFYSVTKRYARFVLGFYYRKLQVHGYPEHVPFDGALFIAANHQNTFLDPVIISGTSQKMHQHNFITRADVFNPTTQKIFDMLKMVPIYRQRESGSSALQKNEEMFKQYSQRLLHEESFIIFVEGNHAQTRQLRPLRKGIARIAHITLEEANYELPMNIVPAGLHYHDHHAYYSDALLVFGPPIDLAPYHGQLKAHPAKAVNEILAELTPAMRRVMIDIRSEQHYGLIDQLRAWLAPTLTAEEGEDPRDLYQLFLREQRLIAALDEAAEANDPVLEQLDGDVKAYRMKLRQFDTTDEAVAAGPIPATKRMGELLLLALSAPLFAYGYLNHIFLVLMARQLPERLVKDHEFYPAIRYGIGLLGTPLLYLLQAGVVTGLAGWAWGLGYLVSLLPAGRFATYWYHWRKRWSAQKNFHQALSQGGQSLLDLRQRLLDGIKQAMAPQKDPQATVDHQ